VVFVRFVDGRPQGYPEQLLAGFLDGACSARASAPTSGALPIIAARASATTIGPDVPGSRYAPACA
jgi:hypothetical protein